MADVKPMVRIVEPKPRGVLDVKSWAPPAKPGVALGLGLTAAGVTGAAAFAAERLSRERGRRRALDEELGKTLLDGDPDEVLTARAPDGVKLHVEIDHPRVRVTPADAGEQQPADRAAEDGPDPTLPTVVLCHGYCLSSECWVFQRRALRRSGYRVVLWDQRGHGRSGAGDPESYRVDTLGDDLAAVLAAAVPEGPLVLVGHSMGGMTLMSYALDHREELRGRVVGAAFVSTSAGSLEDIDLGLGRGGGSRLYRSAPGLTRSLARVPKLVDGAVKVGREMVDFLVDWGSFGSPVPLSMAKMTSEMIMSTDLGVVAAFMPGFATHDKVEALAAFEGRELLVFNGTKDRLTPPDRSDEIVRRLPAAEHVVVEGAGHVIMLEVPDLLNDALIHLMERAQRTIDAGTPTDAESTTESPTEPAEAQAPVRRRARTSRGLRGISSRYEMEWR